MTDITEAIDSWIQTQYSNYNPKLWGFCELMRKTVTGGEEVFPVTYNDERKRVAIDDRKTFVTWMRWVQPVTYEANEDWSFGNSEARVGILPVRLILAHKVSLGENLVFDFVNSFPSKFTISGYQFVFVNAALSIDPDHEQIIQTELGPANYMFYEKHRFEWNVYVINIGVQFLQCED